MQVETFRDQLLLKLKEKVTPQNEKAIILFLSVENNIPVAQRSNPTSYFASLINLFQSTKDGLDAITLLIYKLIPIISIAVLRKVIPIIKDQLLSINLDNIGIGIASQILILCSQEELQDEKSLKLFDQILQFTISDKKKLRKQAMKGIQHFYERRQIELQQVPKYSEKLKEHLKSNLQENNECAQHALTFLAALNQFIPYSILVDSLYVIIDEIQNLDSKYYPLIFLSLEQVLQSNVGSDQTEKLLIQLNQLQPEELNAQHAYIQCIRQCILSLSQSSILLAAQYLPTSLSTLSEFLLQNNQKLTQHCKLEMITIIEKIGKQTLSIKQNIENDIMTLELENAGTLQQKYIATMNYLFSNRFDHANVLEIFGKFFSTIDDNNFEYVTDIVIEFVNNKSRWPHVLFERAFGQLCQGVSLTKLLITFPLKTDGVNPLDKDFDEKSNCWILYILSKYSQPIFDEFLFYLYPLANLLTLVSNNNTTPEQKIIQNIVYHVLEIASNSNVQQNTQQNEKLTNFYEFILNNLKRENPFYEKLLLLIAKLYSKMITFPQLQNISKQYISTLAKLVEQNNCSHTLNAIKVMSFAAPKQYVQEALNKNMEKILQCQNKIDVKALNNMDIILQVICSLQMTSDLWTYCLQFCRQLINNTQIQKKIYKFLSIIMPKVHSSFLNDAYQLILESECEPSSRQKRFQAILQLEPNVNKKIDEFQTFIQQFLPEIVVAIRDNNFKTRQLAEKLIENIGKKLQDLQLLDQFISMVFAGLAAQSNVMKADAIATIAHLIDKFYPNLKLEFIQEISQLILLLLKEHNNEIYKAILSYIKILIKYKFPLNQQIMKQLLDEDQLSKEKNIIIFKRLLMKISKAYPEILNDLIPEQHIKLLKNAIKIDKQSKKKKAKKDQEREQNRLKNKEKKLKKRKDSDLESDEEIDEQQQNVKGEMEMETEAENNLLLKYDYKKEQFHFEDAIKLKKKLIDDQQSKQTNQTQIVEYKDGKVIVHEQKEILGQKRKREAIEEEGDTKEKRIQNNSKQQKSIVHVIKESGASFKSKQQAGGDVTVKGRPEPFAFIQLNPKALNKRFKNQATKAFDEVLSKNTGALKGLRSHR